MKIDLLDIRLAHEEVIRLRAEFRKTRDEAPYWRALNALGLAVWMYQKEHGGTREEILAAAGCRMS